jgi:hypothetical protein
MTFQVTATVTEVAASFVERGNPNLRGDANGGGVSAPR